MWQSTENINNIFWINYASQIILLFCGLINKTKISVCFRDSVKSVIIQNVLYLYCCFTLATVINFICPTQIVEKC